MTQWTLRASSYEQALDRVAAAGFEWIELSADPGGPSAARLERMLADAGLGLASMCAVYDAERDACHPDAATRSRMVEYLRACRSLGGELGVRTLVCVPTYRISPLAAREDELRWGAETIAAAVADDPDGPMVAIEPLNRYETHLINTIADAETMRRAIGQPCVAVMGDLFHMNIEERAPREALSRHASWLTHVHLADSNRGHPGAGHLDFGALIATLRDIGFTGTLSMEFVPADDVALRAGLHHVKQALARATGALDVAPMADQTSVTSNCSCNNRAT